MERSGVSMTVATNKERIEKLETAFISLSELVKGNGKRGMDEIIREVERRMGVLESDFKHFRSVYFEREGLDAMGIPKKKEAEPSLWEKIKPGLVEKVIIAVSTAFIVLVANHWTELFVK